MSAIADGTLLWTPAPERQARSNLAAYQAWLRRERGLAFADYDALWEWSSREIEAFWDSIWRFCAVRAAAQPTTVLPERRMPGATWFPGARLNYAEHAFRHRSDHYPAIVSQSELRPLEALAWADLERQVASVAAGLRRLGVRVGDRVAAYLPNVPETLVAFLASASLGAIWSSCAPDFGERSVLDRFQQIEPTVLLAVDGYRYAGKDVDKRATVARLRDGLPTIGHTVVLSYLYPDEPAREGPGLSPWQALLREPQAPPAFEQVPFDHPLWVLYSSGTTGLPKPIVHGHGGVLIESLKGLTLQHDLHPGDRFFWYSSTGWVMWNLVACGLLVGATAVLYDGSPAHPDPGRLWQFAQDTRVSLMGMSAAFIAACMRVGLEPGRRFDLSSVAQIGSTGSPLSAEGFGWIYERVKPDVWLAPVSGGTDTACGFVGAAPSKPVYAGEHQARCLGVRVEALDERGTPLIDRVGELVVSEPLPSMPLYFWNDPGGRRYRESYFEQYPGRWRHGDWIRITPRGTAVISGRSDSTLNRQGVRMGSGEIYRAVETLPEVLDSLVIGVELAGGGYYMPLFVVLREGSVLDDALRGRIVQRIREQLSPRHVPDELLQVAEVPRTLNGKRLEVPVKKLYQGVPLEEAVNLDAMQNPAAVQALQLLAAAFLKRRE